MIASLHLWYPRRYLTEHLNDSICLPVDIVTRGISQTKPVNNELHGNVEIGGNMNNVLMM